MNNEVHINVSDFGRLRSYGPFLIPVLSGLSFALQALFLPPNCSTEHSNQLIGALFNPSVDRRLKRLWPEDLAQ